MAKQVEGEDLVKYIVQRVVTYMDPSVETHRECQMERKDRVKESWQTRWFGMVPFSMKMWAGKWGNVSTPLNKLAGELNLLRLWRDRSKSSSSAPSSDTSSTTQS